MSSSTRRHSDAHFRPSRMAVLAIPTPELNVLYSNLMVALARVQEEAHVTMPRPTTSSRSTSNDPSSAEGQGRGSRGKRTGGLDPVRRAKTSLVRKLGACADCRRRRIQCDHHDLSLLKKAYDDSLSMPSGKPDAVQPSGPQPLADHPQPSFPPPGGTQRYADLRGLSPQPANAPFHVTSWIAGLEVPPSGPQQLPSHPQPSSFPPGRTQRDIEERGVFADPESDEGRRDHRRRRHAGAVHPGRPLAHPRPAPDHVGAAQRHVGRHAVLQQSQLPHAGGSRGLAQRHHGLDEEHLPLYHNPLITNNAAVQPSGYQPPPSHPQPPVFPAGSMQRDSDLNPANVPLQVLRPSTYEVEGQDILPQLRPPAPNPASSVSHLGLSPPAHQPYSVPPPARDTSLMLSSAAARGPSSMLSSTAAPASFANVPVHKQLFHIGRLLPGSLDVWECQWANSSDDAASLSSFNGNGEEDPCLLRCHGLDQLREHYRTKHGACEEQCSLLMWRCGGCRFLNIDLEQCPQCKQLEFGYEQCFYRYVALPNGMGSRTATSVRASGQYGAFGAAPPSSPFGNNPGHTCPGLSGGETGDYNPGSGTGGSFQQRPLAT